VERRALAIHACKFLIADLDSRFILSGDRVVVQCDVQKNSFVAAFSLEDGHESWRTARDEVPTWSTPAVIRPEGRPAQVVCSGHKHAAAYDLQIGKEIWSLAMPGDIPIPTPIIDHDMVFFTSAHGAPSGVFAVRTSAAGNVLLPPGQSSSRDIAWSTNRGGSYIPTPIVLGDLLYCCNWTGVLTVFEARSGREVYHTRLPGSEAGFTASPVATDDKLSSTSSSRETNSNFWPAIRWEPSAWPPRQSQTIPCCSEPSRG
jgi:outer membrane protein assembly factor BamB